MHCYFIALILSIHRWKFGAMVTPVVMAVLSLPFFGILTFCNLKTSSKALTRALYVGMIGNILSKACK